ncbi:MAG: ACT domain-containing protein, partial [Planctomycetaceae bacterium]|nr:ACT domain-containing protein [Planctomycetaceae bacterium]
LTFPQLDLFREQAALPVLPTEKISRRYYLRFTVEDRPHVFAEIADILGRNGVSLASIIQHETPEPDEAPAATDEATVSVVVMTHRTTLGKLQAVDAELDRLTTLHGPRVRMPVAD